MGEGVLRMRERGGERWNGRGPAAVRKIILLSQDKPILSMLFCSLPSLVVLRLTLALRISTRSWVLG